MLASRFRRPLITEIRDLWPETLLDSGFSRWHPFIVVLAWLERFLYRNSDAIVTVLPHAARYIESAGGNWVYWLPYGIHMDHLEPPQLPEPREEFVVIYAETLGMVNHLDVLVETARRLRDSHPRVRFVLLGRLC
ncbi:MAG: hypothetical protein HY319_06060 [Armatimonadetes bacterium]|nr:hypothetical protein [Armatimonadota bacterium]